MTKQARFHIGYAVLAFFGVLFLQSLLSSAQQIAPIPYSQFQQLLQDGKVAAVGVSDRFIQGSLKEPLPNGRTQFVTTRVEPGLAQELQRYGVV